jgi:putative addiction module CopG family antidote
MLPQRATLGRHGEAVVEKAPNARPRSACLGVRSSIGTAWHVAMLMSLYCYSSTMPRTTSYILGDELDQFVQEQVESGAHESASAVVRAALASYAEQQRKRRVLDAALAVGLAKRASVDSKSALANANARIRALSAKGRR